MFNVKNKKKRRPEFSKIPTSEIKAHLYKEARTRVWWILINFRFIMVWSRFEFHGCGLPLVWGGKIRYLFLKLKCQYIRKTSVQRRTHSACSGYQNEATSMVRNRWICRIGHNTYQTTYRIYTNEFMLYFWWGQTRPGTSRDDLRVYEISV